MGDLRGFWKQDSASTWQQGKRAPGEKAKKKQKIKKRRKYSPFKRTSKAGKDNDRFYLCEACGASARDGVQLHVDHIVPRSKDPKRELDITNLQVLCEDCNLGKGAWDETDWRDRLDLYGAKPLADHRPPCPEAAQQYDRPEKPDNNVSNGPGYPCSDPA